MKESRSGVLTWVCALGWLGCACAQAAGPPRVATISAAPTSLGSASANGVVNPNGLPTIVYFVYGPTTNYGSASLAAALPAAATALSFNGINQNGLVSGFGNTAPTNEITIEFWEDATALGDNAPCFLDPEFPTNRIAVSLPWADGGTYWDFGDITSGGRLAYYPPNPLTDAWEHYALVASQSGNYMEIYRNGTLEAQAAGMRPFTPYAADLLLGGGTVNNYYFNGALCEFRVWRAALEQATIQAWMSSSLNASHPYYSNLAGYWPMNDGSGSVAADQSGNGQNATLQNGPAWVSGPSLTNYQVNLALSNLVGNSLYHHRIVASNGYGATNGADLTFRTGPWEPLPAALQGVSMGTVAWADLDNDGNLDVLLTGGVGTSVSTPAVLQVWHNAGQGAFSNLDLALPGVSGGGLAVGDFDNDGFLDFVIAGTTNAENDAAIAQVWRNQGDGTFAKLADLPGLYGAAVAVGDFDNDGRLDIVITGHEPASKRPVAQVWRNLGGGSFSNSFNLTPSGFGSLAVADFDNDGYLDILMSGIGSAGDLTQLWHNQGDGTFTNVNVNFPGVEQGAVAVADFDNDGLLDILITGLSAGGPVSQIWRNLGSNQFASLSLTLPGTWMSGAAVGDVNNDGAADFLLAGSLASGSFITQLYTNDAGAFLDANVGLPGLEFASAAWGESQNDGRLDLLLTGAQQPFGGEPLAMIVENYSAVANTPPTAPGGLAAAPGVGTVVLTWDAAADAQTPAAGLSYNVRIGTQPGGFDVVSPGADVATGRRRVPALGNAGERLFALYNLPAGTYYWSVQAIDSAFAGSPFAPEAAFGIGAPIPTTEPASAVQVTSAVLNGTVIPNLAPATAWFQWGLTTNYGNTTAAQQLGSGTNASMLALLISPLEPATAYNFRLVATNAYGAALGNNLAFTTPTNPPPFFTSVSRQPGNGLLLQMQGTSGLTYTLLASTNLHQWLPFTNLTAGFGGQFQFLDTTTNFPSRYYRLQFP